MLNLGSTAVLTSQHGISLGTKQRFDPVAISAMLYRQKTGHPVKGHCSASISVVIIGVGLVFMAIQTRFFKIFETASHFIFTSHRRKRMQALTRKLFLDDNTPFTLVENLVARFHETETNEEKFVQILVEFISEIKEPMIVEEIPRNAEEIRKKEIEVR